MNDTTEKQKEFERLLTAYLKDGEVPKDVNVDQIISELRLREESKIADAMLEIESQTRKYREALWSIEYDFNSASFATFWDGVKVHGDQPLRIAMEVELSQLFSYLKKIDEIIRFSR